MDLNTHKIRFVPWLIMWLPEYGKGKIKLTIKSTADYIDPSDDLHNQYYESIGTTGISLQILVACSYPCKDCTSPTACTDCPSLPGFNFN